MVRIEPLEHFPTLQLQPEIFRLDHPLVEQCWQEKSQECGPRLFNGKLLMLERQEGSLWDVRYVEYRTFLAQCRYPELASPRLAIGVHGVTSWQGKLLLGRRAKDLGFYPGAWEFAPAGNLDCLDIERQLHTELQEETGQSSLERITPLCLVYSPDLPIVDIVAHLPLSQLEPLGGDEYSEFHFHPWQEPLSLEPLVSVTQALSEWIQERWRV